MNEKDLNIQHPSSEYWWNWFTSKWSVSMEQKLSYINMMAAQKCHSGQWRSLLTHSPLAQRGTEGSEMGKVQWCRNWGNPADEKNKPAILSEEQWHCGLPQNWHTADKSCNFLPGFRPFSAKQHEHQFCFALFLVVNKTGATQGKKIVILLFHTRP